MVHSHIGRREMRSTSHVRLQSGLIGRGLLTLIILLPAAVAIHVATPVSAQESGLVSFAFWGDPAEEDAYERVISEFRATQPEIDVQAQYTADQGDFQTKIATSFAAGAPPDVFLINYRRFGQYAARGALEPLQSYFDASETLNKEDFYQAPMDAFRYRGEELVCVPQNVSSLVVYVNVDLFEEYGVPVPYEGWSLDEFVDAAVAMTQDFNGDGVMDVHGLALDASLIRYAPFIWGNGAE